VRDDEQKPHIRLSLRASWHNTTKPIGSGDRVNAAFVHGKFTFLSGEICASCDRRFMRKFRKRLNRVTKETGHIRLLLGAYESQRETQNRQQPMNVSVALCMETCRVSTQKSAEGIVVVTRRRPERRDEEDPTMSSQAVMNPNGGTEQ
jgi:hypothetical protein